MIKKEINKNINESLIILKDYGEEAEFLRKLAIYIKDRNK